MWAARPPAALPGADASNTCEVSIPAHIMCRPGVVGTRPVRSPEHAIIRSAGRSGGRQGQHGTASPGSHGSPSDSVVEVLAIRQVGHERDQRLAPVPEAVPGAANYVPQGIERPDTRVHLACQIATRESLIAGDRERERVKLPFFRKSVGGNAALRFQVVPQPRARQGREEQRVQDVYAVVGGRNGDWIADAGLVGIQPHDERTDDQYLVALDATPAAHRRRPC